jgi:hypothetical protein
MLAREFIRRVHFHVTTRAQRRLVGAAYQRRRRLLTHIALDLHLFFFSLLLLLLLWADQTKETNVDKCGDWWEVG